MKHSILAILFTLAIHCGYSQVNLIYNPSFEQKSDCPIDFPDQIRYATYWTGLDTNRSGDTTYIKCVPEYINTCVPGGTAGSPINGRFYQYPRTGNGMSQVQMYLDIQSFQDQRDYLQGKLKTKLTAGKSYCITFYVVQEEASAFSINHIGAWFDDGHIDTTVWQTCGKPILSITPQVYSTAVIRDTLHWTKIQGSFVASGSEKFVTIGNFSDSMNTTSIAENFSLAMAISNTLYSWYLVDDISVMASDALATAGPDGMVSPGSDSVFIGTHDGYLPCKWYKGGTLIDSNTAGFKVHPSVTTSYVMELDVCGHITYDTITVRVGAAAVGNVPQEGDPVVWPNPVKNQLHITNAALATVHVYDATGRTVLVKTLATDSESLSEGELADGLLFLHIIKANGQTFSYKLVH